jgi:flagellar protein FliO/FliZ
MRTLHAIFPAAIFGCLLTAPAALAANGENTKLNLDSAGDAAKTSQAASGGSIVRTIVGLFVVLVVIYGLYWVLKKV